jgi:ribosomal protein L12E/L44/L45/RPP1/RPP2
MRTFVLSLTVLLTLTAAASPAQAQTTHTAPQSTIDAALQQHSTAADADRDTVRRLLARPEVRELAGGMGVDLRRASDAVSTLEGQDLAAVAAQARQAESALAGGQSVTISTTLIIIGLLVLILIIVAVN